MNSEENGGDGVAQLIMIIRKLDPSFSENVEKMLSERGDPPPGPNPSKLIDELLKNHLAPIMKDRGFSKSGANFWRESANAIDVLNIQKSQWNDAWEASFYVNLGVYWKAYHRDQGSEFKSKFPREYECTAFSRVLEPKTKAWTVRPDSDLRQAVTTLNEAVQKFAFPWFEEMHSEANILSHLKKLRIADNFENWLKARLSD